MDLQANLAAFEEAGAQVLAVAVFGVEKAAQMRELTGAAYPLLADAGHEVSEMYGVYDLLGDGLAAPAVLLINRDGKIVWMYVGKDNGDRPSAEALLEELTRE